MEKMCIFISGVKKMGIQVYIGKWNAIKERCMECGKICYKIYPLMFDVIGVSVMVEIHYNF
jgi:hypothetical protein